MPRIISGKAKGIQLKTPEGNGTRPTTDRIKETLFNILMPYIGDAQVLDLFSGTGSLGLECVSRGALEAVFVEQDRKCSDILASNIQKTGLGSQCEIMRMDVSIAIPLLAAKKKYIDLAFMDPPYARNFVVKTLQLLEEHDIIVHDGIVVVEHHPDESVPNVVGFLELVRREEYGETVFSFFVRNTARREAT